MRYYTSIAKYKLLFFCLVLALCLHNTKAQNSKISPYSFLGVGTDLGYLDSRSLGMGGLNIATSGKSNVSPLNPASYGFGVDTLSVMFNIGFNVSTNMIRQNFNGSALKDKSAGVSLSNMEFYFPIFKWWKMGIFLMPFSDVFYSTSDFRTSDPEHIGKTQLNHSGSGGLNKFGWGNAFKCGPISVGVNLNYLFGNITESSQLYFLDSIIKNPTSAILSQKSKYSALGIDLGLTYRQRIKNGYLTIAGAYSLNSNANCKRETLARGFYNYSVSDTAFYSFSEGTVVLPSEIRTGISFDDNEDWLIGADFSYSFWSSYSDFGSKPKEYTNCYKLCIGAELKPNFQSASVMRRIAYRFGGRYNTLNYLVNNKNVDAFGLSLGFGIPIRKSRSLINLSLEYYKAGNLNNSGIREDYFRLGIGFSSVETWFVKRKYD